MGTQFIVYDMNYLGQNITYFLLFNNFISNRRYNIILKIKSFHTIVSTILISSDKFSKIVHIEIENYKLRYYYICKGLVFNLIL